MPTLVPLLAFSRTLPVAPVGVGGLALVTTMVKIAEEVPPWPSLAWTTMEWLEAVSMSSKAPLATVTAPEVGWMAKRPPALLVRL